MTTILMYRGDDRDFPFTVTKGGTPLNLTGATVEFAAATAVGETPSFVLSSADGGITIAADQGTDPGEIVVHIPASATEDFTEGRTLLCDIQVTDSGDVFTWPEPEDDQSTLIRLKVRADINT